MEALNKASNYAHDTFDKIANAASQTAHVLGETSDDLLDAEQKLIRNARHVVRDNPMTALGIAATAGFLLSRLLRSSR